ncbi:hypothetical protein, partial [Pseudomonas aeruginosa]|uniref:hypothetical protein n=1 Tax=Pseudomonas aeruginosa TaxID=287 RepID=UPI001EE6D84C
MRESEASAGEFPLVFDGLGVFRGHFYRVIDFPNPRQNCHRTTAIRPTGKPLRPATLPNPRHVPV